MTSLAEAVGELETALTGGGVAVAIGSGGIEPPGAVIYGDGIDTRHIGRGQVQASYRIVLLAGRWDGKATATDLSALRGLALAALRPLEGWAVTSVGRDTAIVLRGSTVLGCDVTTSKLCSL